MTMETMKAFNIDVNVKARSQSPLFASLLSSVVITQTLDFEEFIINENGGCVTSLGFYPSSSSSRRQIFLQLETFKPDYVERILNGRLHDHVLSQKVSDEIVVEAQRRMSQGFKQPLFMEVSVRLTQNVFNVVPGFSDLSTTDSDQESGEASEKTCAICLEDLSIGSENNKMQIPNCSHWFHENCLLEWLNRNNSCPLCRQPVCEQPEL